MKVRKLRRFPRLATETPNRIGKSRSLANARDDSLSGGRHPESRRFLPGRGICFSSHVRHLGNLRMSFWEMQPDWYPGNLVNDNC